LKSLVNAASGPVMMPARRIMGLVKVSFLYLLFDWFSDWKRLAFFLNLLSILT